MIMAMKESGIEWVGLIPDDWKIAKNNRLFNISKQLVNENWKNTQLLSLTKSGIIEKNINDGGGKQPESFGTYQYVEKDDIVLCLFDIDVSAVFSDRSKYDGMISPAYRVMKCTDAILPVYAKWWFDAVNIGRYYLIYTKSLRKTIDADGFGNILTVVPPLSEQQAIANYLDETCSQIDEIIAEAKASIDEYRELKQSVIFETVTTGLDKNVEMKDSTIEFISSIPLNWKVCRIATIYEESKETGREDLPILMVSINTGISEYEVGDDQRIRKVTRSDDKSIYKVVHHNDLVYNMMRAWQGGFGAAQVDGLVSPAYVVATPKSDVDSRYIEALLRTPIFTEKIHGLSYGVADFRLRLYWTYFKELRICLPPIDEQREIANYIANESKKIDMLIKEKTVLINDLEAYKKSLIYEVVTGKRRVV